MPAAQPPRPRHPLATLALPQGAAPTLDQGPLALLWSSTTYLRHHLRQYEQPSTPKAPSPDGYTTWPYHPWLGHPPQANVLIARSWRQAAHTLAAVRAWPMPSKGTEPLPLAPTVVRCLRGSVACAGTVLAIPPLPPSVPRDLGSHTSPFGSMPPCTSTLALCMCHQSCTIQDLYRYTPQGGATSAHLHGNTSQSPIYLHLWHTVATPWAHRLPSHATAHREVCFERAQIPLWVCRRHHRMLPRPGPRSLPTRRQQRCLRRPTFANAVSWSHPRHRLWAHTHPVQYPR